MSSSNLNLHRTPRVDTPSSEYTINRLRATRMLALDDGCVHKIRMMDAYSKRVEFRGHRRTCCSNPRFSWQGFAWIFTHHRRNSVTLWRKPQWRVTLQVISRRPHQARPMIACNFLSTERNKQTTATQVVLTVNTQSPICDRRISHRRIKLVDKTLWHTVWSSCLNGC